MLQIVRAILFELGSLRLANLLDVRAARMKVTAARRICRAGNFTFQNHGFHYAVRVEIGNRGHEGFGVRMERLIKQFRCRREFHDAPQIHHRDPIANMFDDTQIMRNEQISKSIFFLCVHQQVQNLRLNGHIEGREPLHHIRRILVSPPTPAQCQCSVAVRR